MQMEHEVMLYMFDGSTPALTAKLMLEHKGIAYKPVHVMPGLHAFGMLARGFETMTVPALKIDGRRVQGSRQISRELDDLVAQPPLFPGDPRRRRAVEEAERRGEELQDIARRVFWCVARRDPRAFDHVLRPAGALRRWLQRITRRPVTSLATAGHRATDWAVRDDLVTLPARLDEIDAWIEEGVLDGAELNAADFQIATTLRVMLAFADFEPLIAGRPAERLARGIWPDYRYHVPTLLPPEITSAIPPV